MRPRRGTDRTPQINDPSVGLSQNSGRHGFRRGLTIWLLTVASWNEAESAQGPGSDEARLNLHRLPPDWAGDTSPWDQLRSELKRPLWIVSDESHNQHHAA